jgi:3-oxoadipate enol-lactonase
MRAGRVLMAIQKVKVRDGAQIACKVRGDAKASPALVLVHSLAMDHSFWDAVASPLTGTTPVVSYDCRGHGQSSKPEGRYSAEQFADDLADLVNHFNWRTVVVAGASMGGCIALAYAAAYPGRVAGLGLFDTTAAYNAPDRWEERAVTAETQGLEAMVEFQSTRWFTDAFRANRKDVVDAAVAVFLANPARCYAQACRMLGSFDATRSLPRLKMPARIVVGEEDYATPVAMSEVLHRGIAGSSLTVIPKARHLTPLECPDKIAAELQALLATVSV